MTACICESEEEHLGSDAYLGSQTYDVVLLSGAVPVLPVSVVSPVGQPASSPSSAKILDSIIDADFLTLAALMPVSTYAQREIERETLHTIVWRLEGGMLSGGEP